MEQMVQERSDIAYDRRVVIPLKYGYKLQIMQNGDSVSLDRIGPANGPLHIGNIEPEDVPELIKALAEHSQWATKFKQS